MNERCFNRRRFFRRPINEAAWVEKVPTILERCTLVDVSTSGARLTIRDTYDLPESFTLHLALGAEAGRLCQIVWQRDHEIGVEFLSGTFLRRTAQVIYSHSDGRRRPPLMSVVTETSAAVPSAAKAAIARLAQSFLARAIDFRLFAPRRPPSPSLRPRDNSRASRTAFSVVVTPKLTARDRNEVGSGFVRRWLSWGSVCDLLVAYVVRAMKKIGIGTLCGTASE
jgi:PilZ domain